MKENVLGKGDLTEVTGILFLCACVQKDQVCPVHPQEMDIASWFIGHYPILLQNELNKATIAKTVESMQDREGNSGATHVQS